MPRAVFMPALGNHDLNAVGPANWINSVEIRMFELPENSPEPERYFSFEHGDALFVVYCAGPHCNGSTRAALRIAQLGRPVKEMIGGITGWRDEGFALATS